MKAIILAAGMGTRLGKYTQNLPKGMLSFMGKSLIQRQVETLHSLGIKDIIVIKGYKPETIQIPGVKYYENKDYANTNMVETLFAAETEMDDDLLVCYSDIIYEKRIIQKALRAPADIGVVADEDYLPYWQARLENWQNDIESFMVEEGQIKDLGNTECKLNEAPVRIVGIVRFSKRGLEILKKIYHQHKKEYFHKDTPWLRSKSFKQAYTTCMLQAIINAGHRVDPILIRRGWMEFDTVEDYEKAMDWVKSGSISRFINLNS